MLFANDPTLKSTSADLLRPCAWVFRTCHKPTVRFLGFQVSGNAVTRQLAVFTVPHLTCVALQTYYVNAHHASRRYDDSRKEKLGAN